MKCKYTHAIDALADLSQVSMQGKHRGLCVRVCQSWTVCHTYRRYDSITLIHRHASADMTNCSVCAVLARAGQGQRAAQRITHPDSNHTASVPLVLCLLVHLPFILCAWIYLRKSHPTEFVCVNSCVSVSKWWCGGRVVASEAK